MSNPDKVANESRRKFLVGLSLAMGGLAATAVGIPVIGALLAPLLNKSENKWRTIGNLDDFPLNTTKLVKFENSDPVSWAGVTGNSAAWVRRDTEGKLEAFSVNCTHLGCPVRWDADADLFLCPCHGGVYYKDGKPAAGPPQKPLPEYKVRINNQKVELLTQPIAFTNIQNQLEK